LVAIVYGIIRGGELATVASVEVLAPTLFGVAVLALFVWWELRTDHPAFDVRNFSNVRFSSAIGMMGIVFFAMMGGMFFLTFYMQIVLGFSPIQAGALMIPFAAAQLIFAPLSQRVNQRFGAKVSSAVSMLVVTAALTSYAFLDQSTPIVMIEIIFFVQGAAMANIMPPATTAIMEALPREKAGVGSAMSNTVRQIAGALGVAVLGSVLSSSYRGEIAPALSALPAGAQHAAGESIMATVGAAHALGRQGQALLQPAYNAFLHGMHITALVSAVIALLGVLVVLKWMPGKARPVQQAEMKEPAVV
ncbi:MAG TPA: MFS transporter, partial [Nonomuraea sp.]|nr:MFS transporter [Nonomuraea sp.]